MNNQMSLIKRAIARHYRLFHADERPGTFTRRNFVRSTLGATGALMSASAWAPTVARAQSGGAEPKPIPGGVSPFGIPVHHFPLPAAGTPLSSIHDPSEITDFNGFIVDTSIRGAGTDTVSGQSLAFKTDMGAMQGQYVGEDGRQHHGTFVFI
jgi:hypothetical protein